MREGQTNILVIEDNAGNFRLAKEMLSEIKPGKYNIKLPDSAGIDTGRQGEKK
jgi:CheY-like chemotaxis protein